MGALLIGLCGFIPWIEAPLSGGISVASVGWVAISVGLFGSVVGFCGASASIAVSGMAGLGLCLFLVLHLTFHDSLFWRLVDENEQYAQMMAFAVRFLPRNLGIEPTFQRALSVDSALDRMGTAVYFMSYAWWICLTGSVLLLAGALTRERRRSLRSMAATLLVLLAGLGFVFFNGFAAERLQASGAGCLGRDRPLEAIQHYEAALRLSPQLLKHEDLQLHLGEAYDRLAMYAHPHALLYRGDMYARQKDGEAALVVYLRATEIASEPLAQIINRRVGRVYVALGLAEYRNHNIGLAVTLWEKAVASDDDQLIAANFLARAYFDQGRYEQSIAMGRRVLARSRNRLVNANVHANIGDSYWRLQDYASARNAYQVAQQLDSFANFRIIKSLGGT